MFVIVGIMTFIFRKQLKAVPEKMEAVANLDNSKTITDYPLMIRSAIVLGLVILGFVLLGISRISKPV